MVANGRLLAPYWAVCLTHSQNIAGQPDLANPPAVNRAKQLFQRILELSRRNVR
jgi:hypothetical protein